MDFTDLHCREAKEAYQIHGIGTCGRSGRLGKPHITYLQSKYEREKV